MPSPPENNPSSGDEQTDLGLEEELADVSLDKIGPDVAVIEAKAEGDVKRTNAAADASHSQSADRARLLAVKLIVGVLAVLIFALVGLVGTHQISVTDAGTLWGYFGPVPVGILSAAGGYYFGQKGPRPEG